MTLTATIVIFISIILLHEAGHMVAAKAFGATVTDFSFGMGKKLIGTTIGGTEFNIRLFPIGGSCDIPEEEMEALPFWKQTVIYAAGCTVNFAMAVVFATVMMIRELGFEGISRIPFAICTIAQTTIGSVVELFRTGVEIKDLAGPVTAVDTIRQTAEAYEHPMTVILLMAVMFSLLVGAFNLIPIPPLDGGEILSNALKRVLGEHKKIHRLVSSLVWVTVIWLTAMAYLNDVIYVIQKAAGVTP